MDVQSCLSQNMSVLQIPDLQVTTVLMHLQMFMVVCPFAKPRFTFVPLSLQVRYFLQNSNICCNHESTFLNHDSPMNGCHSPMFLSSVHASL